MEGIDEYLFIHHKGNNIMKKNQFLTELRNSLNGLPKESIEDRVSFYDEMIQDKIEDGKSEEEAVAEIGTIKDVSRQIIGDTPLMEIVKERTKQRKPASAGLILIIVLGFPLWFPLLITLFVLVLVGYILLWTGVLVSYVVELSLGVASIASLVMLFIKMFGGNFSMFYLGSFILGVGLAILLWFGCIGITKGTAILSKNIFIGIKSLFIKKGEKK